jgi:hypothetical protein
MANWTDSSILQSPLQSVDFDQQRQLCRYQAWSGSCVPGPAHPLLDHVVDSYVHRVVHIARLAQRPKYDIDAVGERDVVM